jgi:protein-disulfide isomerase
MLQSSPQLAGDDKARGRPEAWTAAVWRVEMKPIAALGFAAALAGTFCLAAPAGADEFTPAQKQELGAFIKDYLVNNPEVLRDAIVALDKHDKEVAAAEQKEVVANQAGALFDSKFQATIGNPKANATLVEFFDYNCHYCKGALPDVTKLLKDDPNLKLVLKDYPVLGPGSVEAAKVASAARNQLPGDKFWPFHAKLLGTHGPVGKNEALAVARDMGLDMDRLAKDMDSPEVKTGLEEVMQLADSLQVNGTPTFVVGQDVVVGAVGYDELKGKVDSVHKCGRATC